MARVSRLTCPQKTSVMVRSLQASIGQLMLANTLNQLGRSGPAQLPQARTQRTATWSPTPGSETVMSRTHIPFPHSPVVTVTTLTSSPLPVSTGLFQTVTPPFEVSTPYQDAMCFREQAEALYQEEARFFDHLTPSSPKSQRIIQEHFSSADRSAIEAAWSPPLTGSALPDNEDKDYAIDDTAPSRTHPLFIDGEPRQLGEGKLK